MTRDTSRARATRLVHFDRCPGDPWKPTVTPIHQTATFEQEDPDRFGTYDYSRSGNPTRSVLEAQLAALDGGARALAYASGMAAIAGVCRLLRPGDRALVGSDLYGGTTRFLDRVLQPLGVGVEVVDATRPDAVRRALAQPARLVWIETPSNPLQQVAAIAELAEVVHGAGALLVVDGTMMSPWFQRPLEHGADIVVHSATKSLCGHADVTAGSVVVSRADLAETLAFHQNAEGTALGPFDAWLLLRGMKTLGVRLEAQARGAERVASALRGHRHVSRVHWVGFDDHPGAAVHRRQAQGPPPVMAVEMESPEAARQLVAGTRLFATGVSFGAVSSSICIPTRMSHASATPGRVGFDGRLVRLSVGIEDPQDLIEDLAAALSGRQTPRRREDVVA